jgi:uncharacterized membrane protein
MKERCSAPAAQLVGMLLIAAVATAVFWIAQGAAAAVQTAAILLLFIAAIHLGRRRSDAIQTISGIGDERIRSLNQRATAVTANVLAFVVPGWWLITVLDGRPNATLGTLAAIFGATYLTATVVLARRG